MYTFTNQFMGSILRRRIDMINSRRSGSWAWWRYAFLFFTIMTGAFACQFINNGPAHKYIHESGDVFFSLITAKTSDADFDTLRQELTQRDIKLNIDKLIRLANGQIQQLTLTIQVPKPGHPINTGVGSSIGQSTIPAIGLRCDHMGCQLSAVNEQFPKRLQALAIQEDVSSLLLTDLEHNAFTDANAAFGLYRVFFRNDFLESNYFGLRKTAIRMTPDYHLDVYPEYQKAVIFLDGQEINRDELARFPPLDLKKVIVFNGEAAVMRLGNIRAKHGLILLSRLNNITIRDKYAATPLLEMAYPKLFSQP
jgi:hypothetical protein